MALPQPRSLAYDDEELYDKSKGMPDDYEPPEYPPGCCFRVAQEDMEAAGLGDAEPDDVLHFAAMCEVTSVHRNRIAADSRIELQMRAFAGPDGKFVQLGDDDEGLVYGPSAPPCICLCGPELDKMDLDDDAERGDLIHLVGTARIEHLSSNEYGGEGVGLQITALTYAEDESDESREHMK